MPANLLRDTRQLAADLLGAELREIALVGPTSLGLSFIAHGIDWRAGDNLIVHGDDYPSNVYPWMALAERGVELKRLEPSEPGRIEPEDVFALVDSRTRMAALASCHYVSGYRIDLDAIGRELRSRGVLFCVDGIQTMGAFPTRVEHVDFLAADAHKWMLGPCSSGAVGQRLRGAAPGGALGQRERHRHLSSAGPRHGSAGGAAWPSRHQGVAAGDARRGQAHPAFAPLLQHLRRVGSPARCTVISRPASGRPSERATGRRAAAAARRCRRTFAGQPARRGRSANRRPGSSRCRRRGWS